MLIRHCDQCNHAIDVNPYIQVSLESDGNPGIVGGLPLRVQGDYCGLGCLYARINDMLKED